jgi:hypothetical protein
VCGVVAVEVPDLPAADGERELAAAPATSLHAGPGGDFLGDPPARAHDVLRWKWLVTGRAYKLK